MKRKIWIVTFNKFLELTFIFGEFLDQGPVVVLQRQLKRPRLSGWDRLVLLWLANKLRTWKSALLIVQPDTRLRWHRDGFRRYWRAKSKARPAQATIAPETIALIKQMAAENRTWGAQRICGELLKVGLWVANAPSRNTCDKPVYRAPQGKPGARFCTTTLPTSGRVTSSQ